MNNDDKDKERVLSTECVVPASKRDLVLVWAFVAAIWAICLGIGWAIGGFE